MHGLKILAALIVLGCSGLAARSQELGNAVMGERLARDVCAGCHQVSANQIPPGTTAPSFREVANTPGMNETALFVWLQTSHPTMPNLVLTRDEMQDVVAYIFTLRRRP